MTRRLELTLGPLLFNWPPDRVLAFYREIAERAPVDRVYLGEVVCGKRAPLLAAALATAAEDLEAAGMQVVWSAPALPVTPRELRGARALLAGGGLVEVNDASGLALRPAGAPFVAGPFLNVYNENAARELVRLGCVRLCANIEVSLAGVAAISRACPDLELEIFAYGRLPLALAGRCHHARLHGLHKDACQFVCGEDPDGLAVDTLEGEPFLALNGVQTLSHGVQLASPPIQRLRDAGVAALRLSPHTGDLAAVAGAFRRFADGHSSPAELRTAITAASPPGPLVNGYLAGAAGMASVEVT
jgi:collagenase-like PrtC family protease